jgi:cytochrome P450
MRTPLGETYDPVGAHADDLYPFYALARREEPVFFHERLGVWVITRDRDVREVLRRPEAFSSANAARPEGTVAPAVAAELRTGFPAGRAVSAMDGDEHRRHREPLARALSAERVDAVTPFLRERATALVDAFADEGRTDLVARYASPLTAAVVSHLLGIDPDGDHATAGAVAGVADHGGFVLSSPMPDHEQPAGARRTVAAQHLLAEHVRRRRTAPSTAPGTAPGDTAGDVAGDVAGDDLIAAVAAAAAPGGGPPGPAELADAVASLLLVMTSARTTTSLLALGLLRLLRDGAPWRALVHRPALIPAAVEELCRLDGPVQGAYRVTTRRVTVAGVTFPPGAELLLLLGSANRDEAVFERPDELDLIRLPTGHLAFGEGEHACVGAHLARRQLQVTLELLTGRLPGLRLAPGYEPEHVRGTIRLGLTRLDVAWS